MADRLSNEDVERIARAVERGVTRSLLRILGVVALGLVTIWLAPMLFFMAFAFSGPRSGAASLLGAALAALTIVALALAWYLLLRQRRASTS